MRAGAAPGDEDCGSGARISAESGIAPATGSAKCTASSGETTASSEAAQCSERTHALSSYQTASVAGGTSESSTRSAACRHLSLRHARSHTAARRASPAAADRAKTAARFAPSCKGSTSCTTCHSDGVGSLRFELALERKPCARTSSSAVSSSSVASSSPPTLPLARSERNSS
eukprot:5008153-Pleurochrysis_carterae.AAC.2